MREWCTAPFVAGRPQNCHLISNSSNTWATIEAHLTQALGFVWLYCPEAVQASTLGLEIFQEGYNTCVLRLAKPRAK